MKTELLSGIFKKTSQLKVFLLIIFLSGFIADVFFIKVENTYKDWGSDLRLFLLLILWVLIVKVFKFSSFETFKLTLIFMSILSLIFIFFRSNIYTERLASWVYVYLVIGVVQQLFEKTKK